MLKLIAFIALLGSPYQNNLPVRELLCLSTAVYHESRGEPLIGQVGVAHTVLNRVRSSDFPNTICGVVYQPKQFTDIHKAKPKYHSREWYDAIEVSVLSFVGYVEDPTFGADHYYAQKKVYPWWAKFKTVTYRVGGHTFLK